MLEISLTYSTDIFPLGVFFAHTVVACPSVSAFRVGARTYRDEENRRDDGTFIQG